MRLFVALNLPATQKRALARVLDELRAITDDVRWVDPESLHLTLKFLGEVKDEQVATVRAALTRAAADVPGFTMRMGGFGTFPSRTRARVFWIGIDAPPALFRLQQNIEAEIAPLGFPSEQRKFQAHITLGRTRAQRPLPPGLVDRIAPLVGYNAVSNVTSVDLMRSHLSRRGARYELLYAAALNQGSQ